MDSNLEAQILSGEFFAQHRSTSPTRTPSPDNDASWHGDELELSSDEQKYRDQGYDSDSEEARRRAINAQKEKEMQPESIGMGPGRTGVKGVIRDRDEAVEMQREKKARDLEELRRKMEASSLGGKTYLEEEREKAARGEKADELVMRERGKTVEERLDVFGKRREGRFGHLREVGVKGFLSAVEEEDRGVWVVIHLYEPSLERCYMLDETLSRLARAQPETKFLRARASALGFATSAKKSKRIPPSRLRPPLEVDEDDPYGDDDENEDYRDDEEDNIDDNVDLDMLPTMLVYRDGELVHNWVRVDWEAQAGIEELLEKHHILPRDSLLGSKGNLGLPSDDEDDFDLMWDEDDDINH
ncbi:thioredoxin-like protein [Crucibulum laeve]|uniref:Thioredoxin-like protein n=1 Tax=Crucibulum laeve TaxID=68775 RepID=A0A5C3MAH3_9AGAR|nr:thioredoxin-like protein [Crucibulum laeve]